MNTLFGLRKAPPYENLGNTFRDVLFEIKSFGELQEYRSDAPTEICPGSRKILSSAWKDPSNTANNRQLEIQNQMSPAYDLIIAQPACIELCDSESKDGNCEYASQEVRSEIMKLLTWWNLQQRNQRRENNLNSSNPMSCLSDTSPPPKRYHRKINNRNTPLSTITIN